MRKILMVFVMMPFLFASCSSSSDDKDDNSSTEKASNELVGKKYEGFDSYEQSYDFTFGDNEFQRINDAIYFVPKEQYTASWTYNDTLLTTYELTTKQLILSFVSGTKSTLMDYTQTNVVQQKAEVYHHYYRFKEDYYVENGLYMVNISANSFAVYDKTKSIRYDFRLDGNYSCNISFYMKKGGIEQDMFNHTDNYTFNYKYEKEQSRVDFIDDSGHSAYGFFSERHNTNVVEKGFSLYFNDKTYFLKE